MSAALPLRRALRGALAVLAFGSVLVPSGASADSLSDLLRPAAHEDAKDTPGSPLDIIGVRFGQAATDMVLAVRTAGTWEPRNLDASSHRSVCIKFFYGQLKTARARVCLQATKKGEPQLRYTRLDPFGHVYRLHEVPAAVERLDKQSFSITVPPSALGLSLGRFSWQVETQWTTTVAGDCVQTCVDKYPNGGPAPAHVDLLRVPACFGAAARAGKGCTNPQLARLVVPTPDEALLGFNAFCLLLPGRQDPQVCRFRSPPPDTKPRTVALIGDSHAAHWRGALNIVASAHGWLGLSLTRAGCPFTASKVKIRDRVSNACNRHNQAVLRWLQRHPEIRTIFVSNHNAAVVTNGVEKTQAKINGYLKMWKRLPRSVRRVIVIRDTPKVGDRSGPCVTRAFRDRKNLASVCARPRSDSVPTDPQALAARRSNRKGVRLIDMTDYFCGSRYCMPVVGGVLVHKDTEHMNDIFSETLGPYLLRRIDKALR